MREHCKTIVLRVVWKSDATTIRLILAFASLLWAMGAIMHESSMDRVPYVVLDKVAAGHINNYGWAALFFLHFLGVMWRTFDPVERVRWALAVNTYGLFIWLSVTLALTWEVGSPSVTTATDWALCVFAAWALFKTGISDDLVTA